MNAASVAAVSIRDVGARRTIAADRYPVAHEAIRASFDGQDHAAPTCSLPDPGTGPPPRLDLIMLSHGYLRLGRGRDGVAATAWFADVDHPMPGTLRATAREVDEDRVTIVDIGWYDHVHTLVLAIPKILLARTHVPDALPAWRYRRPEEGHRPPMPDQPIALADLGGRLGGADERHGLRTIDARARRGKAMAREAAKCRRAAAPTPGIRVDACSDFVVSRHPSP